MYWGIGNFYYNPDLDIEYFSLQALVYLSLLNQKE